MPNEISPHGTVSGNTIALAKLCVIVPFGQGSRVLRIARSFGINGGTIMIAHGSYRRSRILDLLGLNETRNELVWMVAGSAACERAMQAIHDELHLEKPNHGIAFYMAVRYVAGIHRDNTFDQSPAPRASGGNRNVYHLITVIVENGRAQDVIMSAESAGSGGGTILNARGSGIHERAKLFSMEIEPEKEVVLILSQRDRTEAITKQIRADLEIDKPGRGIIFVQDVDNACGLREQSGP
ncbi:MAG: P-II family nitrogen regulator [Bacillota bacterium]|nr:P-II family nitrogen regulator [Bacillota bacterium]